MNLKMLSPVILCLLLLLTSCASPQSVLTSTPIPPTRTPLPSPISSDFPTGIFYHKHASSGLYCVFTFSEDGTFSYYWMIPSLDLNNRMPNETGTYSVDGSLYTVTSTDFTRCPPPATYTWTYDGENLTFQVFGEDTCSDRQQTYESPLLYKRK